MSPEHVHDEAITLLIAGHETTGATLAWAWHLMALHPEIGDRLAAEVHAVVGDAPPVGQDLPRLTYARWIFAETLPWYMRRLAERPANVWFVAKNLLPTPARISHRG